jgi:glutaminase
MPTFNQSRRDMAFGLASFGLAAAASPAQAEIATATGVAGPGIESAVKAAYDKYRGLTEGKNFDHPALINVPSHYFGIALLTRQGKLSTAGDIEPTFTIQSISKVFTLALVLQESGEQVIEDSVGVDATGRVFNSIEAVEAHQGRDMNPLVNPGAIATTGNVKGANADEIWAKILGIHSAFAGRPLTVDQEIYKSASSTNQHNRAISMLMSAYGRFPGDPDQALDLYTRQCSIAVSAKDLGIMAATLAAGGRNPVSGKQVIDSRHVPGILAIMATAGLYESSGQWLFHTGLPAKSGVAGGLIAVAPGKFGIGTFAPPLDAAGNSVRGQKAIADISNALGGNPYAVTAL